MIVPEQQPNRITIDAEIKGTTSVVFVLGHASHEEALQIAAYLYLELEKIKRSADSTKEAIDNCLGYNDDL
jgi:hypothetical protein